MSAYETMSVTELNRLLAESRTKLHASDAGTGLTHANPVVIASKKGEIALRLNRMAYYLHEKGGIDKLELSKIASECAPFIVQTKSRIMSSI